MKAGFFLLGFRARAFGHGLIAAGSAVFVPGLLRGLAAFITSPAGPAIAGMVIMMAGGMIEEAGGLARIRAGLLVKLGSVLLAFTSIGWGASFGADNVFAWAMVVPGLALLGVQARFDLARYGDTRTGESVRLESSDDSLTIAVDRKLVVVPYRAVSETDVIEHGDGRSIAITVAERGAIQGDAKLLPWAASIRSGDIFILSEHQCNRDARELAASIDAHIALPKQHYR